MKVETTVNNRDGTTENLPFDPISDFVIKLTKQHIQEELILQAKVATSTSAQHTSVLNNVKYQKMHNYLYGKRAFSLQVISI